MNNPSHTERVDIAVIGGGINGCGIARDAAGRGLGVLLCEQNDLASGTSSASTKLIHGGLRYLEHYKFRLVREALIEREVLLRAAPHLVSPMRFVLPHHAGSRPAWLIRAGLFLYDHLGGRELLPGTKKIDFRRDPSGSLLSDKYKEGFEYSDCWVDDARLVVLNARDAADRGALIHTQTACTNAERRDGAWVLTLEDRLAGTSRSVRARVLINAAGPWVTDILSKVAKIDSNARVRLVRGSHILVPRLFDHGNAYIFQNGDGRIVFAIPYQNDFTLIGTTDEDHAGGPGCVTISEDETNYLCQAVNLYLRQPIRPADVVHTYSGVRPLYDDGASKAQEATRDYVLKLDAPAGEAPLLSVFGGKITTYRKLAEAAMKLLRPHLGEAGEPWTAGVPLPGGNFDVSSMKLRLADLRARYNWLAPAHVERLFRGYGTDIETVLNGATKPSDLGINFGADLYEQEVRYLMDREWALSADDILWRRGKFGLRINATEQQPLINYMAADKPRDHAAQGG